MSRSLGKRCFFPLIFLSTLYSTISSMASRPNGFQKISSSSSSSSSISKIQASFSSLTKPASSTLVRISSNKILPFTVRIATIDDIEAMDKCNIATLPENYEYSMYRHLLTRFPTLCLVACASPSPDSAEEVIGYALARIEEERTGVLSPSYGNPFYSSVRDSSRKGHISSLAVYHQYRGFGVAKALMDRLHENLVRDYDMDSASLNVRVSNEVAIKLYSKNFLYKAVSRKKVYYDDGEDAIVMAVSGLRGLVAEQRAADRPTSLQPHT